MSDNKNTPTPRESALHAHLHAVLAKLEEVKTFALNGLHKIVGFVENEAPIVEAGAAAVAAAIPVVGPVVAVVEKVAAGALGAAATANSIGDLIKADCAQGAHGTPCSNTGCPNFGQPAK